MKVEIKIPSMGESITEATIGTILKSSGSHVAADDELLELETDKVNQVLYAPQAGVVTWSVKKEDVVAIGQVVGVIDSQEAPAPAPSAAPPAAEQKTIETAASVKESTVSKTEVVTPTQGARITKEQFVKSTPAKSLSETQPKPVAAPVSSRPETKREERETRKKMSKIRRVIANRLVEVQSQTAMLTTFNEVDMSNIMALRESYKESFTKKYSARLGFMSFFIKASVAALKAFPEANGYIDGDDIVYRNYYDIGVAVGTERGVIVPVIRDCDLRSFADIERAIEEFAKKARDGNISVDDLQGGGFTITNGGVYGSLLSTPILNPPQSAILGMHKIMKRPVVVNDTVVIRQMMYLALSYDHRIIDGKEAVSFLVNIKNCLEDPSRLLLDI